MKKRKRDYTACFHLWRPQRTDTNRPYVQITQPAQTITLPGTTSVIVETSTLPPVTFTQTAQGTTFTTTLPASSVIVTRTVSQAFLSLPLALLSEMLEIVVHANSIMKGHCESGHGNGTREDHHIDVVHLWECPDLRCSHKHVHCI